jgi:beta-glucosidase
VADAEQMKYKDPKQPINTRIKDLLGRMTLAEKIGQMTQIERQVASADVMKKYFIGKVHEHYKGDWKCFLSCIWILFGRYRQMKPITLHSFGCFVTL